MNPLTWHPIIGICSEIPSRDFASYIERAFGDSIPLRRTLSIKATYLRSRWRYGVLGYQDCSWLFALLLITSRFPIHLVDFYSSVSTLTDALALNSVAQYPVNQLVISA